MMQSGKCDRCLERSEYLSKFPFLFKVMSDRESGGRPDLGQGYRQFWGCRKCIWEEKHKKNAPEWVKP